MRRLIKYTIGLPILIIVFFIKIYILIIESVTQSDDIFKYNIVDIKELLMD